MISEKEYTRTVPLEHRKRYAQFFTPEHIADFMASWVLGEKTGCLEILEPAFGLGVFTRSMCRMNPCVRVRAYDVDTTIYAYAQDTLDALACDVCLYNEDYITASWTDRYDGIVCNPPYLKFHDYDNSALVPLVNGKLHTSLNGFTNLYTLFLLKSVFQMKDGGRMAYIIPSEFLNADYGVEVKRTLLQSGVLRHVIIVDFTQCAFDDALTTACILLCEKDERSDWVHFSCIDSVEKLEAALTDFRTIGRCQLKPELKWKQYYEHTTSSEYANLVPFSTFAKVSRGIATGTNSYFTFKRSKIDTFNIPEKSLRHCVCHSADIQTTIFTESDFNFLANRDRTVYLFDGCGNEHDPNVDSYIRLGEKTGADRRYLTASRTPWYALENRKPSPIWVSVFNRNGLRFVRNKAGVYNLTTFHCVYNNGEIDTDVLFAYLVTDVAKEIFLDNSRQYGNGLVKFEPNDLNKGNIVDLRMLTEEENRFVLIAYDKLKCGGRTCSRAISILDQFFRAKYTGEPIDLAGYTSRLARTGEDKAPVQEVKAKRVGTKQVSFFELS